ncbi:MAG: MBL fold metallo-hydrolase [Cellvibrionaceae bacterium]
MKPLSLLFSLFTLALIIGCEPSTIGKKVLQIAAEKRLGENSLSELDDGLHLLLCGAGSPLPDPVRSGPCTAVLAGNTLILVDAGSGSSRSLSTMGVNQGQIHTQLLTHFHSDHIDGLGELAMQRWVTAANQSPLPVIGPKGTQEIVEGFNRAYSQDSQYRHAHHGEQVAPLSGTGMKAHEFSLPEGNDLKTVFDANGLTIRAFRVVHNPVEPAVGYRFDYKGRSVVISGDTAKSENVEKAAQSVDLLVHEALSTELVAILEETANDKGLSVLAKILFDIPDYHTSPVEAAEIANAAQVGHLLYYHIVPALPAPGMEAAFLEGTEDAFNGPITLGVDGTLISLPANSDRIISSNLL